MYFSKTGINLCSLFVLTIVNATLGKNFTDAVSIVISLVSTLLLVCGCWICRVAIFNGLAPLKKFKGNSDTGVAIAAIAGGKGGGRPDFAMAGAKDAAKAREAVNFAEQALKEILG